VNINTRKEKKMISVIVPYQKDRGYLTQCLDSIKNQSYKDFEIIEAHGHGNLPQNFNWGLSEAKGEFIKMVQDDDWLPVDGLKHLIENIGEHPWIVGNVWQESAIPYIWKPPHYMFDWKHQIDHYDIHMGSTLYRTALLRAIDGMDETLTTGEEYDMHLKLLSFGYVPAYVDKEVYHYRMWSGGKSRIYRRQRTEWRKNELEKIRLRYVD
jgi:glycosyltransferase involved in cell wall biosynthesis